ncbi:hypothetical protein QYZ88_003510 [Lachnospiraceae bacterium C1.1]|nr:hypothetical protein [Lachnospiraceae bacterium C1.1]
MKKNYEKPVLNSSMTGTLEGVYAAYGLSCTTGSANPGNDDNGGNGGNPDPGIDPVVDPHANCESGWIPFIGTVWWYPGQQHLLWNWHK